MVVDGLKKIHVEKPLTSHIKGSRYGAVVKVLVCHQQGTGSNNILAHCHVWVEFFVGFSACLKGFSLGNDH